MASSSSFSQGRKKSSQGRRRSTSPSTSPSSSSSSAPLPGAAAPSRRRPGPNDVLCGRGGATNGHEGNKTFRALVASHQEAYLRAPKREKRLIARDVVEIIRSRGGAFLKRTDAGGKGRGLADIGDKKATEKTSQALREGLDARSLLARGIVKEEVVAAAADAAADADADAAASPSAADAATDAAPFAAPRKRQPPAQPQPPRKRRRTEAAWAEPEPDPEDGALPAQSSPAAAFTFAPLPDLPATGREASVVSPALVSGGEEDEDELSAAATASLSSPLLMAAVPLLPLCRPPPPSPSAGELRPSSASSARRSSWPTRSPSTPISGERRGTGASAAPPPSPSRPSRTLGRWPPSSVREERGTEGADGASPALPPPVPVPAPAPSCLRACFRAPARICLPPLYVTRYITSK